VALAQLDEQSSGDMGMNSGNYGVLLMMPSERKRGATLNRYMTLQDSDSLTETWSSTQVKELLGMSAGAHAFWR
jgi:hypothetical protein